MKALTLTQPWASLVATGEKMVETRSWRTNYRGPLAIHAAQGLGPLGGDAGLVAALQRPGIHEAILRHHGGYWPEETAELLPRGQIVAIATLGDVVPTESQAWPEAERLLGNFTPGRWAWYLGRILKLGDPIDCRGRQGLWDVPRDVVDRLREIDFVDRDDLAGV